MSFTVRNICFGQGQPKICLPVVEGDDEAIIECIDSYANLPYDMIELRIDYYQDLNDLDKVCSMLKKVRDKISKPLLFTYRSLKEGGMVQLSDEQYQSLITAVCQSGDIDLVDIELESGNSLVYELVSIANTYQVKVIMSYHCFDMTPASEDLIEKLEKMELFGADMLKIAVMPLSKKDVIRLIDVTMLMSEKLNKPLITMSMGELGKVTRMIGELTGSSVTFASGTKASAPGQIHIEKLKQIMEAIHD